MQATGTAPRRRNPFPVLARRWPTALALAVGGLSLSGGGNLADEVNGLGEILLLLPLEYLLLALIGRRAASWPVVGALAAVVVVAGLVDVVPVSTLLVGIALVLLVVGTVRGTPHGRGVFGAQAAGMLVFGALALAGLAVDPDLGRYIVAGGWLAHGLWDVVHLKRDKVVSRSYAECCGVLDVVIAAGLLFLM